MVAGWPRYGDRAVQCRLPETAMLADLSARVELLRKRATEMGGYL